MVAGFSQRFPAVTADLGSIWSCQNEMRNRSRQIGELYTDVNTVIGKCDEWTGLARDAFVTSADAEKHEIGRACLIVCVSVFCLKGLMHDE